MPLKAFQKKYLKSLSHSLSPNVMIGKNGLTGEVLRQIEESLRAHELLKIKLIEKEQDTKAIATLIREKTDAEILRVIGRTITIFRENPENEKDYFKACGAFGQKKRLNKGKKGE